MTKQETNIQRLRELGWTEKPSDEPTCRTFARAGLEADAWEDGTVDVSASDGTLLHLRTCTDVDDALQAARDFGKKRVAAWSAALAALEAL